MPDDENYIDEACWVGWKQKVPMKEEHGKPNGSTKDNCVAKKMTNG